MKKIEKIMDYEIQKQLFEKDAVITALTELCNRCPVCYRTVSGTTDCSGCLEYYPECGCEKLTATQIDESIWDD